MSVLQCYYSPLQLSFAPVMQQLPSPSKGCFGWNLIPLSLEANDRQAQMFQP